MLHNLYNNTNIHNINGTALELDFDWYTATYEMTGIGIH